MTIQKQCLHEIQEVLKKYNAELDADDHWTGYAECGRDIRITLSFKDLDDVDLGQWITATRFAAEK